MITTSLFKVLDSETDECYGEFLDLHEARALLRELRLQGVFVWACPMTVA